MFRRALAVAAALGFAHAAACTDYGDDPGATPDAGGADSGSNMTDAFVSPIVDGGNESSANDSGTDAASAFFEETFETNRPLESVWVVKRDAAKVTPTFQVSNKLAHSGTYSFEIESDPSVGGGYGYLEKSFGALPLPLHFQYWINFDAIPPGDGDHTTGMVSNQLGVANQNLELAWAFNGKPGVEPYIYQASTGSAVFPLHEWIQVRGEVTADHWTVYFVGSTKTSSEQKYAGTPAYLQFGFQIGSGGGHWHFFIDDVKIEAGPLPAQ